MRTVVYLLTLTVMACEANPASVPAPTPDAATELGQLGDAAAETAVDAAGDSAADAAKPDAPAQEVADSAVADAPVAEVSVQDVPAKDVPPSEVAPADVAPADVAPQDVPGPDAIPTCITDGKPVQCSGAAQVSFPTFDADCKGDGDCFAALHQINCCGTQIAIGTAVSCQTFFTKSEQTCEGQYPGCGCAQFPTLCQDGFTAMNGNGDIGVQCKAGKCRTYVKSAQLDCKNEAQGFPKPWKQCQADTDCAYVLHYKDCCGSLASFGIAAWAKADYDAAEKKCFAGQAVCDCMSKPTTTEDGQSEGKGGIGVKCQQGACMTFSKP